VICTLISSLCVAMIVAPSTVLCGFGSIGVHIVNVLLHSFCNEIAAAWMPVDVYAKWVGRCYFAKRASNATMAFLCTLIFRVASPEASFTIVSSVVFLWSFVLFGVYWSLRLMPCQAEAEEFRDKQHWIWPVLPMLSMTEPGAATEVVRVTSDQAIQWASQDSPTVSEAPADVNDAMKTGTLIQVEEVGNEEDGTTLDESRSIYSF